MAENLFSAAHKHNSNEYIENWDNIFRERKIKIFSYGTLMSGQSRNGFMGAVKGKKLIDVEVKGLRLYANYDHPTIRKEKGYSVKGELWEFGLEEEEVLDFLDRIEGYPDYYGRKKITVGNESAWVYIMTDMAFEQQLRAKDIAPIESGDWKNLKPKKAGKKKKRKKV